MASWRCYPLPRVWRTGETGYAASWPDSLVGKGIYNQASQPMSVPGIHVIKREPTLESYSLINIRVLWHTHAHTHVHMHTTCRVPGDTENLTQTEGCLGIAAPGPCLTVSAYCLQGHHSSDCTNLFFLGSIDLLASGVITNFRQILWAHIPRQFGPSSR